MWFFFIWTVFSGTPNPQMAGPFKTESDCVTELKSQSATYINKSHSLDKGSSSWGVCVRGVVVQDGELLQ